MELSKTFITALLLYLNFQTVLSKCNNCPDGVICVDGFDWNGNTCVYSGKKLGTTCTNGFYWKGNKCISYQRGVGFPQCDSGSIWNSGSLSCLNVHKNNQQTIWGNCIEGFYWNGKTCLILGIITNFGALGNISPQQCIFGYSWNGYTCVFAGNTAAFTCLHGYYWNGITCTYSSYDGVDGLWAYGQFGNRGNINFQTPNPIFGGNILYKRYQPIYSCIQGTIWNGQACVYSGSNINACANGYYWDGITCIYYGSTGVNIPTICSYGKLWNGHSCIMSNNNLFALTNTFSFCPSGYYSNGYYCLPSQPTICSGGQVWNGLGCSLCPCNDASACQGYCQGGTIWSGSGCIGYQPYCPKSYVWNGVTCIINIIKQGNVHNTPLCIHGYIWNGVSCIYLGAGGDNRVPGVQICSINYIWDGSKCILSEKVCVSGYIWTGVNCVLTQLLQSNNQVNYIQQPNLQYQKHFYSTQQQSQPIHQHLFASFQSQQKQICAPGYTYSNGVCIINTAQHSSLYQCLSGYIWNGAACILTNPGISSIPSCPNGFIWTGQTCMPFSGSNTMNCATGFVWSYPSGFCIPYSQYTHGYGTINCISGTYWNGAGCISYPELGNKQRNNLLTNSFENNIRLSSSTIIIVIKENSHKKHCVNNWIWNGYSCVNQGEAPCQAGQYWNGRSCQRSSLSKFCIQGQYWDGIKCVIYNKTEYDTPCSDGYYWFNPGMICALQQPINICSQCK